MYQKGTERSAKNFRDNLGQSIDPTLIERVGQKLRATFDVWFGPLEPMPPVGPEDLAPRRFDYPSGVNLMGSPRSHEPVSFRQMRELADSLDLVRIAIETRKDQVGKMPWGFREKTRHSALGARHSVGKLGGSPRDVGIERLVREEQTVGTYEWSTTECRLPSAECPQKSNTRPGTADGALTGRIDELTEFFQSPDREHSFDEWVRMIVEELLVIDAVTLAPTIDEHGGVWSAGKKPERFEVIDGATIKRVIDDMGRTPTAPEVAYQQILKGLATADFTSDELVYRPRNLRVHKFYGYSPVEQILMTINLALRRQMFALAYYTEGNIPEAICQAPEAWNSNELRRFQEWFDSELAGNLSKRRKVIFLPNMGGRDTLTFTKEAPLSGELDEWLARVVCWAFSISPQALIKQMNRATAETAKEQSDEEGITPLLNWLASLMNGLVRKYFGYDDVEFAWGERRDENKLEQAQINQIYVASGVLTVDEVRESLGREALGSGLR